MTVNISPIGNYRYYLDANDTLPTNISINEITGKITRGGTIPDGAYSFNVIAIGMSNVSGYATSTVNLTVLAIDNSTILTLSGTLDGVFEIDIEGKTIILTLSNSDVIWDATIGADNALTQGLIDGIVGSESGAVIPNALDFSNVVRTTDNIVTITLPAIAAYDIDANDTITVTAPANTQSSGLLFPQSLGSANSLTVLFANLLLDEYTGAGAAYSLRKISATITNVIRVRRSSDNAESNFTTSQIVNGDLLTFVGAGNGFVTIWYDQSGNGFNGTQTVLVNQPKIVNLGVMITDNGLPSIDFSGATVSLNLPNSTYLYGASHFYGFVVTKPTTNTSVAPSIYTAYTSNNIKVAIIYDFTTSSRFEIGGRKISTDALISATSNTDAVNNQRLVSSYLNYSSGVAILYENSVTTATNNSFHIGVMSNQSNAGIPDNIGGGSSIQVYNGNVQELIIYPINQSANRAGIETNINDHYSIY
jgi:hypothetical protein